MREDDADVSFADFEFREGLERPYAAPNESGVSDELANPASNLVELRGIEPRTLRLPGRDTSREK